MSRLSNELLRAVQLHLAGDDAKAEECCLEVLAANTNDANALHLLGVIASRSGRVDRAVDLLSHAVALQGDNAEFHNNLGTAFRRRGDFDRAIACHCEAVRLSPNFVAANFNLANALRDLGQLDEAAAAYLRVTELEPNFAEAWFGMGNTSALQGDLPEAVKCYRRALGIKADFAEALSALGDALKVVGQIDEAIVCCRRALALKPDFAEAHNHLGNALRENDDNAAAQACYLRALELKPDLAEAHFNLGTLLREEGDSDAATEAFRRALEVRPNYADACNALGNLAAARRDFPEARGWYDRAIDLNPDMALAHMNRGTLALLLGDFEQGWSEYEWRWKTDQLSLREFGKPRWTGEGVEGKTVLVWEEQGLGDRIQFVRYLQLVKERGARVVLECQRALGKLLSKRGVRSAERGVREGQAGGCDQLVVEGEPLPEFDFQVPLMSLPGIFGTKLETIPAEVPYLWADEELVREWKETLEPFKVQSSKLRVEDPHPGPRPEGERKRGAFLVGINWHGRAGKRQSKQRDVPLEMFERLAGVEGVRLVRLQKSEVGDQRSGESKVQGPKSNVGEGQRRPSALLALRACVGEGKQAAIVDLGEIDTEHGAFMDTAAIMMNLDLVITSDTSVAHLAGALGVSVWVALPYVPDWRWLLDRSDSPWYPTMRLFRQKKLGDWAGVFEEIEEALRQRVSGSKFQVSS